MNEGEILETVGMIVRSIRENNHELMKRLQQEIEWSRQYLQGTARHSHLEKITKGKEEVNISSTRPTNGLRSERGLGPLLVVRVRSRRGEIYFRFEPVGEGDEFQPI